MPNPLDSDSTHWTAVLASMAWCAFFILLIFRPLLVWEHPVVALVFFAGFGWWAAKARRSRRREKRGLLDPPKSR